MIGFEIILRARVHLCAKVSTVSGLLVFAGDGTSADIGTSSMASSFTLGGPSTLALKKTIRFSCFPMFAICDGNEIFFCECVLNVIHEMEDFS